MQKTESLEQGKSMIIRPPKSVKSRFDRIKLSFQAKNGKKITNVDFVNVLLDVGIKKFESEYAQNV